MPVQDLFWLFCDPISTKLGMTVGLGTQTTGKILWSGYLDNACHGNQKTLSWSTYSMECHKTRIKGAQESVCKLSHGTCFYGFGGSCDGIMVMSYMEQTCLLLSGKGCYYNIATILTDPPGGGQQT